MTYSPATSGDVAGLDEDNGAVTSPDENGYVTLDVDTPLDAPKGSP